MPGDERHDQRERSIDLFVDARVVTGRIGISESINDHNIYGDRHRHIRLSEHGHSSGDGKSGPASDGKSRPGHMFRW